MLMFLILRRAGVLAGGDGVLAPDPAFFVHHQKLTAAFFFKESSGGLYRLFLGVEGGVGDLSIISFRRPARGDVVNQPVLSLEFLPHAQSSFPSSPAL